MKMYAVLNLEDNTYLNYASKKKKLFGKGWKGNTVESPFPTLRPESHIKKHFLVWIMNTPNPENYRIVKWNPMYTLKVDDGKKGRSEQ